MAKVKAKLRGLVTVDFGGDVEELDRAVEALRVALKDTTGFTFKRFTRSFAVRLSVKLLTVSLKRNELLRLMKLLSEVPVNRLRPLGEGE